MVHKSFPYAPCINTSQPSDPVYTCNNLRLLKLHQIKCNAVNVFFILTKKPLTKNALVTSLSRTFKPTPPYIFFSGENRFSGAVADGDTTASELKTPLFQKQIIYSTILFFLLLIFEIVFQRQTVNKRRSKD